MLRSALVLSRPLPAQALASHSGDKKRLRVGRPLLSVVIVNYCQWESTSRLVEEIRRTRAARRGAIEIIVVDNHSPRHVLAARMRRWPGLSLRRWGRNRGFARAVNEGCRLSQGRWCLLLNPDMTLTEGFVDAAVALAERLANDDPRAGIVGFQLLNSDGSRQLSSGPFPTLPGTLAGLLLPRARRKYRLFPSGQRCREAWVTGCCLLVRRECLQELGGLDESFFLYYEDVDLCWRVRAQGWSVWYEPGLRAVHHDPGHGRPVPPALRLITRHSLLTYARRYWPRWQLGLLTGMVRIEAWVRRMGARWRGDTRGAGVFAEMSKVACELWRGDAKAARRRLEAVVKVGDPRTVSLPH